MRSPGRRAVPQHRAPSTAARVRTYVARMRGSAGRERPGADEALSGADDARLRPHRSSSRRMRISPALRRLMVTPTFAAGLGVVVAAFLAANMSRTVLHFSAPIPGNQCSAGDCHAQEPHGGTLASARPGVHITPRVPDASGPVRDIRPGGSQPGGSQSGGSQSGGSQSGGSQSGGSQSGGSQSWWLASLGLASLGLAGLGLASLGLAGLGLAGPGLASRAGPLPRPGPAAGRSPA